MANDRVEHNSVACTPSHPLWIHRGKEEGCLDCIAHRNAAGKLERLHKERHNTLQNSRAYLERLEGINRALREKLAGIYEKATTAQRAAFGLDEGEEGDDETPLTGALDQATRKIENET